MATVWLVVVALAMLPADGVARGPVLLLTQPRSQLALSAVSTAQPQSVQPGGRLSVTVAVLNGWSCGCWNGSRTAAPSSPHR